VRTVDQPAIAAAALERFRSEYHYALWEYLRSAKVIEAVERAGTRIGGRVLDSGCGGGGTALSIAEESSLAIGLDLDGRFVGSGTRLLAEKGIARAGFVQGNGQSLPFRDGAFDLVLSHSVIEHVLDARAYLRECHRVLRPGGTLYLSTAPFLSLAGAHLPRLLVPVPLHLLFGRRLAFRAFCALARHAPWALRERKEANTFIALAAAGKQKEDDLHQRVTLRLLTDWIREAGFRVVREERHVTGFFRALPGTLRRFLERTPFAQDVMTGHVQCVLERT
jgi:2-polyprenyl-3-methyl-5-hydroxy-6-metoxy-1,4-benzoquinol methylase